MKISNSFYSMHTSAYNIPYSKFSGLKSSYHSIEVCIYPWVGSSRKFPFSVSSHHRAKWFNHSTYAWREDLMSNHVASTSAILNVCFFFSHSIEFTQMNESSWVFFIHFMLDIRVCAWSITSFCTFSCFIVRARSTKSCFICKFIELVVPSSVFCYVSHPFSLSIPAFIHIFALFCPRNVIHF